MQEVPVRSTTGFLTLFIGLIDFRLSPSNAPDVFGLKTISPSFLSLSLLSTETLKSWSLREKFWISVGPFNQAWKQVFVPKRDDTPALCENCRPDSNRFLQLDKHIYVYRVSCRVVNKAEIIEGGMYTGLSMINRIVVSVYERGREVLS